MVCGATSMIDWPVSSGAMKADATQKLIKNLKALNYVVNTVTPEQEGRLALRSVLPPEKGIRLVGVTVSNFAEPQAVTPSELPIFAEVAA